jgi:retron-type reverse transcriptase
MGLFSWLRRMFGGGPAPAEERVPNVTLQQLQQMIQSLGVAEWYYTRNDQTVGPFTPVQLQQLVSAGQIRPDEPVWKAGQPPVPLSQALPVLVPQVPPPVTVPRAAPAPPPPRPSAAPAQPAAAPQQRGPLQLDAADFLPIEESDLKQQAQKMGSWSPWFGRRDIIPPADDTRTKLIDRALVSNGLLTPEQLAEIHNVGAEMDRVRPTQVGIENQIYRAGEDAVQAERDRKARLKAEKKAAAERRKKEHAEAVAQRRATDIVFLGRGVSRRLSDRKSDVDKLNSLGLPVLATPAELADALGLRVPRLRWLAFHAEVASRVHYIQFTVPKKSGGVRTLSAPHRALAQAQRWIFENVVSKLPTEPAAHGFVAGKSILTNAREHIGKPVVVNVDLEDFFPSITFPRVRSVFQRAGYSGAVATIMALLCTECPRRTVNYGGKSFFVALGPRGLPQGACTSPGLSNQIARRLDRRLTGLARKLGMTYTRYADDLSLSGSLPLLSAPRPPAPGKKDDGGVGYLLARLRHIAEEEGFRINEKKSRVLRKSSAQMVTGLVVNAKPNIRRSEIRRVRSILHHARKEGLESQNRDKRPNFRSWLRGKIAYIKMVRPDIGAKMEAELQGL